MMEHQMRLAVCLTLAVVMSGVAACHEQGSPTVALYPVCAEGGVGAGRLTVSTKEMVVGKGRAPDSLCVTMDQSRLAYRPGKLHIYPYKGDRPTELRLQCDGETTSFYSENAGKDVVLLAAKMPVGIYNVVEPSSVSDCGLILAPSFPSALKICEMLTASWGIDSKQCEVICTDPKKAKGTPICTVVTKVS